MKKILKIILLGAILLTAGCKASIPDVENLSMRKTVKFNYKLIIEDSEEKEFLEMFYNKYKKTDEGSPSFLTGLTSSYTINYRLDGELVSIIIFEKGNGVITQNDESENVVFDEGVYEAIDEYFKEYENEYQEKTESMNKNSNTNTVLDLFDK